MPYPSSNYPAQWGWKSGDAADIVPFTYQGMRFANGVVRGTEKLFIQALDFLVPQIPGGLYKPGGSTVLTSANQSDWGQWGYENRISRNSSAISFHAFGLAIDINSGQNPNATSTPAPSPYRLPLNTGKLLDQRFGAGIWRWGGDWGDWMHIEIHLSPSEVAAWNAAHPDGTPAPPTDKELFTVAQYDDIMAKLNTIAADAAEARLRTRGTNPAIDSFAVLQMGIDSIDGHVLNDAPHWVVSTLQQAISDAVQKILTGILEQPIVSNVDSQTYPLRMLLQAINDHTFKGNAVDQSVTSSVDGKEYSVANILQAVDARVVELLSRIRGDNADLDMPQRAIQSLDAISASVTRIEAK